MDNVRIDKDHTVYVTKYALTQGILHFTEGEITSFGTFYSGKKISSYSIIAHKGEWTYDEFEALVIANKMIAKKIASLQRQIVKMKKLLDTQVAIVDADMPS